MISWIQKKILHYAWTMNGIESYWIGNEHSLQLSVSSITTQIFKRITKFYESPICLAKTYVKPVGLTGPKKASMPLRDRQGLAYSYQRFKHTPVSSLLFPISTNEWSLQSKIQGFRHVFDNWLLLISHNRGKPQLAASSSKFTGVTKTTQNSKQNQNYKNITRTDSIESTDTCISIN